MPTYPFTCDACGIEREIVTTMRESSKLAPLCCGSSMRRIFCIPQINTDIKPYKSMIDGSMITSRAQHKAHLKQHGCFEIGNETETLIKQNKPKPIETASKREIHEAIQQVKSGQGAPV